MQWVANSETLICGTDGNGTQFYWKICCQRSGAVLVDKVLTVYRLQVDVLTRVQNDKYRHA